MAQASGELNAFRRAQQKAFSVFGSAAARASTVAVQRHAAAMTAAQSRIAMASRSSIATIAAPAALAASYKQFADVDRQISRIGVTANASAADLAGVRKQIEGIAYETAQSSGKVTGGLDVLVAQGRSLKEGLEFLPSVARTAAAAGAEIDDIAKSADAVSSNFKIAGKDMQSAFDIMAEGGKAGQFELKDMAQYLPGLAPAASAAGFSGTKGLTEMVAMLQVMRKGSGSASAAESSMSNIFQKMETEETAKKFKKMGVDLAAGLAKGRKEGRNLVEVFEELTAQALKGDLSKIPQLFADTEFSRGVRALMTYRGEWQKLAKTISETSAGSVGRDLDKVTKDARAQIDRMFATIENRAVQAGGFIAKNIVLPIDEALKRIDRGENSTANKAAEWLQDASTNLIANQELDGATPGKYGADTRRLVDARKEILVQQRVSAERERLGKEIGGLEGKRADVIANDESTRKGKVIPASVAATLDARRKAQTDAIDGKIAGLRQNLASLENLFQAVSDVKSTLGDVERKKAQGSSPRFAQQPGRPDFAQVGSGTTSFAPNLSGGGAVTSVIYGGEPISTTLPPSRAQSSGAKTSSSAEISAAIGEGKPFSHERPPGFKNDTAKLPENPQGSAASNSLFSGEGLASQSLDPKLTKTAAPGIAEITSKVEAAKSSVESLGPAGASAGSALASGFSSGVSAMEAQLNAAVDRMQAKLNSLSAPSLSLGGMNTGKGMAEVR
ncbi:MULTISPECIES: phage tail tape measure protein [unclassified Bosea (in: a-proteobacteria)]|uniref:phage tail tape measure protein n=1 Tax=unclassified Bosea (in: a-proteobacteria) TaxID=2653178 RepID=UPI0013DEF18C|nr:MULTISPECIES: phage tail tape measure protein [unclassified Bosea (in: a-proteobacteria)]